MLWDFGTLPFLLVAVSLGIVNIWFQTHGTGEVIRNANFLERLLGAGGVVWFYLYKALLPVNLAFAYPPWHIQAGNPLWWTPLLAVIIVSAVLVVFRETRARPLLFAWGFFCVSLVPVLGFTDVGFMKYSLVADHYQHIAIIGVIALVAAGWGLWYRQARETSTRWLAIVPAFAVVGFFTYLTCQQTKFYRDEVTLYYYTLNKYPECWFAYNNLGYIEADQGHEQQAFDYFQKATQLRPDYAVSHNNYGNLLYKRGRLKEAIEHLKQAIHLKHDYPEAHHNLGLALLQTGRI